MEDQPLPPGWASHMTENGTLYYHHEKLGSTWDRPVAEGISLPQQNNEKSIFGFEDGKSLSNIGDGFMSSITNFLGKNDTGSTIAMEGNLKGSDHTQSSGMFSQFMSLKTYFNITGEEFMIRSYSVFLIIKGMVYSTGSHTVQASMYHEKPDLYAMVWINLVGAILLGFLPNLCKSIFGGIRTNFLEYHSSGLVFSLFPLGALFAGVAGYVDLHLLFKRADSRMNLQLEGSDDPMVSTPVLLCLSGYASIPIIIVLPLLMLNNWMFRLPLIIIAYLFTVSFLCVVIRGNADSFMTITPSRKIQYLFFAGFASLAYLSVMLKLPTSYSLHEAGVNHKSAMNFFSSDDLGKQQQVEEVLLHEVEMLSKLSNVDDLDTLVNELIDRTANNESPESDLSGDTIEFENNVEVEETR